MNSDLNSSKAKYFGAGAWLISPIVDKSFTFNRLDQQWDRRFSTLSFLAFADPRYLRLLIGYPLSKLLQTNFEVAPVDFFHRFYNEFQAELHAAQKAVRLPSRWPGYETAFRSKSLEETELDSLRRKNAHVFIWFAQDNPILSGGTDGVQPESIFTQFERLRDEPEFKVLNPRRGGHVGLLLQSQFHESLSSFFKGI